ncbi:hypothetical protein A9239_13995 [Methanosarcina sp. A14]|nr:hypothetical protein A9239_13995 [Methanosarcina sp. A14]
MKVLANALLSKHGKLLITVCLITIMDNKYYSYWLALIILSGIFYIIFGAFYAVFGFCGFLIVAGVFFVISVLYGIYSVSHKFRS